MPTVGNLCKLSNINWLVMALGNFLHLLRPPPPSPSPPRGEGSACGNLVARRSEAGEMPQPQRAAVMVSKTGVVGRPIKRERVWLSSKSAPWADWASLSARI